jgi:DNA modification methylase
MFSLYNDDYLSCINKIDNNSVGLILTDIPYNISKKMGLVDMIKKIIEIELV